MLAAVAQGLPEGLEGVRVGEFQTGARHPERVSGRLERCEPLGARVGLSASSGVCAR